jgi:hypothetical protein
MYDSTHLFAFHLQGKPAIVEIERVEAGTLKGKDGKEDRKPLVYFRGKSKPLALNRTNGASIAGMYGKETRAWVGKRVELFPTTTQAFGAVHDCIRIRPKPPGKDAQPSAYDESVTPPTDAERDPGSDDR